MFCQIGRWGHLSCWSICMDEKNMSCLMLFDKAPNFTISRFCGPDHEGFQATPSLSSSVGVPVARPSGCPCFNQSQTQPTTTLTLTQSLQPANKSQRHCPLRPHANLPEAHPEPPKSARIGDYTLSTSKAQHLPQSIRWTHESVPIRLTTFL